MDPRGRAPGGRRITVAAWIGSANLGDELVFAGLARQLHDRGLDPVALSVDPAGTTAAHGVAAVRRSAALTGGGGVATVLGGGGLLQDETSTLNLDLHLSPVLAARARRRPVVGVGLGAGRLSTRSGRLRVRAALAGVPLTVRDAGSADVIAGLGLERPAVAADLALSLPRPTAAHVDHIAVCLRPWSGRRHHVPARFRRHESPEAFVAGTARALDALSSATGLPVRFVAFDAPKDAPLHDAVGKRMSAPYSLTCPSASEVLEELAASRLVVSMRYHGGIGAVLAGRPAVLVGYSPKVTSLADDIGAGAVGLRFDEDGLPDLTATASDLLGEGADLDEAYERLQGREQGNGRMLDRLVERLEART